MKKARMCQKSDTEANWELYNPVLYKGEIAFSSDTGNFKIGDGINRWRGLPYYMEPLTEKDLEKLCK